MLSDDQNPELEALRRRKLELKRKKIELIKANGLAFYQPHEKQKLFHEAGVHYRRRMLRSGNRFGKSTMGVAEDCSWLLQERTFFPEGHPARKGGLPQHPVKLLIITTDWSKVDEVFTSQRGGNEGKMWKFLPKSFVKKVKRNHDGVIDIIECHNGSVARFDTVRSWLNNPQGTESSDWDAIHVDEPCPEGMWKSASRGLMDRHGSAWFTLTPLNEFWINDMFFPEDTGNATNERNWAESGSTYDNPYLSREAIQDFESTLTDEEKQCRIHGIPLHLAGLIYKQFSQERHLLKAPPEGWSATYRPPASWPHYFYIDPHPQTPHCVLYVTVDRFNRRYYYADHFKHCSIEELATDIKRELAGRFIVRGRIDPLAFVNDPITMTNMASELADHGVYVEKATKALAQGILRVQGELSKNPNTIFFAPTAKRSLWEIQRYCWDEKENKPKDEDDHAMECLYRAELDDPKWVEAVQPKLKMPELVISGEDLRLEKLDYLSI